MIPFGVRLESKMLSVDVLTFVTSLSTVAPLLSVGEMKEIDGGSGGGAVALTVMVMFSESVRLPSETSK